MAHIATMGTGEASRAFASVIAKALRQVGDGRVTAANARLLRRAIAATTIEHRFGVAIEPERSLGAFEAFPQAAREAIIHAIKDQDRWRFALSRGQRALRARLGQGRWGSSATRLLLGQWQAAHWGRLLWQGQFAARPTLAAMLALARLQPSISPSVMHKRSRSRPHFVVFGTIPRGR